MKRFTRVLTTVTLGLVISTTAQAQTLHQAIVQALKTHPDVLFSATRRLTTNETVKQALATYYPTVELTAGYGREHTRSPSTTSAPPSPPAAAGTTAPITLNREEFQVNLVENLFNGRFSKNEVERTSQNLHSDIYDIDKVSQDVALDVVRQYIRVQQAKELIRLAQNNLRVHKRIMRMIKERTTAGVARKAEEVQAKGRLALAHSNVIAEQSDLNDETAKFIFAVGQMPRNLVTPAPVPISALPRSEHEALDTALRHHPTLKAAKADIAAARAQHRSALSVNLPTVDLVLNSGRNRNLDGIVGRNDDDSVMLRARYDLFRGGADMARQRETAYKVQEATEVKNRTTIEIDQAMRLAWNQMVTLQQRLGYLRDHRKYSKKTVMAYKEQFKIGQRTLLDLLDSENEFFQSSIEYVKARTAYRITKYRILNAEGLLLKYFKIPLPEEAYSPAPYNPFSIA